MACDAVVEVHWRLVMSEVRRGACRGRETVQYPNDSEVP